MRKQSKLKAFWHKHGTLAHNLALLCLTIGVALAAALVIWVATVKIPDFSSFEERKVARSTKIYDRTGQIVLYDVNQDIKRTVISLDEMGENVQKATIAVEDADFYSHHGIKVTSIIRAVLSNLIPGGNTQGGSTITQQVVKMTLLSPEKTIARKTKEWILSVKLDRAMTKDEILGIYLNEAPYGGMIYGVQEASTQFFGKVPRDLSLAEAAYLAAIPQSPTYYSPYGKHREELDWRKDFVLYRMQQVGYITKEQYETANTEKVTFLSQAPTGIKAPHFVFYVKEYLEDKYGPEMVESGGLKVTTTLDFAMQEKAEVVVREYAEGNVEKFNATNAALVAIAPKTGDILAMVGSRDYFSKDIDGNFNVALARRQPGSSFKPFVYATAFMKGFTPDTVLFDVPTEFQASCDPYGRALPGYSQDDCYMPVNYDGIYRGPMSIRNALAQSINVPAVKTLYLVGIKEAIRVAKSMGIKSLNEPDRYGLTLVLGGGEVSLLDMTSAYGVFANNGVKQASHAILKVEDATGKVLEEYVPSPETVLPANVALMISDVLSDNVASRPLFGTVSPLYFGGRDVAAKTGTTNDYRDVWTVGYTPSLAVGAWAGNNDNSPMVKKTSGTIIAPLWHAFMEEALKSLPDEQFEQPIIPNDPETIKPVIRGIWQGGESFFIDSVSGKLATSMTPKESIVEKVVTNVHTILHWVDKSDPMGPAPEHPERDSQYRNWETAVQVWWNAHAYQYPAVSINEKPSEEDDVHTEATAASITITSPIEGFVYGSDQRIDIAIENRGPFPLKKADMFINGEFLGTVKNVPFSFSFVPSSLGPVRQDNVVRVVAQDSAFGTTERSVNFRVDTQLTDI